VTLSQIVHLTLRSGFEPDANFAKQRAGCLPANRSPSLDANDRREARCETEWEEKMKYKDRISEREYHDRLEGLLKSTLNVNLQPLRSLDTATKKRRAQKKAVTDSGLSKSTKTISG
jgi:hypothetical protein